LPSPLVHAPAEDRDRLLEQVRKKAGELTELADARIIAERAADPRAVMGTWCLGPTPT
jgi:hypothetical protein